MSLVPAKCSECGGILQLNSERDSAFCQHCNTTFIVEKTTNNFTDFEESDDFAVRAGELIKYIGSEVDVIIPQNVTHIGNAAFKDCIGLRSVKIPNSVVSVGENAFMGCANLTDITINQKTTIHKYAFSGCVNLVTVNGNPKDKYAFFKGNAYLARRKDFLGLFMVYLSFFLFFISIISDVDFVYGITLLVLGVLRLIIHY